MCFYSITGGKRMKKIGYEIELRTATEFNEGFIIVTIDTEGIDMEGVLTEDYLISEDFGDKVKIYIYTYDSLRKKFDIGREILMDKEDVELPFEFRVECIEDERKFLELKTTREIRDLSQYEEILRKFKKGKNI